MPAIIRVRILAARGLPVMDRASDAADAFVEVSPTGFYDRVA